MKELMLVEQFFYAMEPYYAAMQRLVAESLAEVALFEKYILPPLRNYAGVLHGNGKYLMTHTDGENRRLMPLYLEAGFDIADSVCPAPMTHLTLDEILAAFRDRIAVWGGVSDAQFRLWIDDLFKRYGHRSRFVLGVSNMGDGGRVLGPAGIHHPEDFNPVSPHAHASWVCRNLVE